MGGHSTGLLRGCVRNVLSGESPQGTIPRRFGNRSCVGAQARQDARWQRERTQPRNRYGQYIHGTAAGDRGSGGVVSASGAAESATAIKGVKARRILVVDDNSDAAALLAVLLELEGHEVQTAADAGEAVN